MICRSISSRLMIISSGGGSAGFLTKSSQRPARGDAQRDVDHPGAVAGDDVELHGWAVVGGWLGSRRRRGWGAPTGSRSCCRGGWVPDAAGVDRQRAALQVALAQVAADVGVAGGRGAG